MICSINEIRAVLRKAAMGSGFPAGLADAIAAAGVWLCAHGRDGLGAVLAAVDGGYEAEVAVERDGATVTFAGARVGRCGPSAFELIAAGDADEVIIEDPDSPTLLEGMAGVASTRTATFVTTPTVDGRFTVVCAAVGEASPFAIRTVVAVDEEQFATASALAARILVPATDESRLSGAGAGLTDND